LAKQICHRMSDLAGLAPVGEATDQRIGQPQSPTG
jgi:hypothetical protein